MVRSFKNQIFLNLVQKYEVTMGKRNFMKILTSTGVAVAVMTSPTFANGLLENRPWQFQTTTDKANKSAVLDLIERKKAVIMMVLAQSRTSMREPILERSSIVATTPNQQVTLLTTVRLGQARQTTAHQTSHQTAPATVTQHHQMQRAMQQGPVQSEPTWQV